MTNRISTEFTAAIQSHISDIKAITDNPQNWESATLRFDAFFRHMSNQDDSLWNETIIQKLTEVYFAQREKDKGMSNITLRTVIAMPESMKNDTKKIFLQVAEVCCIFNASHKVNFEADELPVDFDEIKMIPSKSKGLYTYASVLPSLYKKTSLTFDYWVPKILEWTIEIRANKLKDWRNEAILHHESCTDFMRICLLFLSDPAKNPPVAKAEEREALLKLLGEEFTWKKKSAKREDILSNSNRMKEGLTRLTRQTGINIPLESWSRIQQEPYLKSLIKYS